MAIGERIRRVEDPALLRGAGRFVADIRVPGCLEAAIVRSPHAHARLAGVDVARALRLPCVAAAVTAADLPPGLPSIPMRLSPDPRLAKALQPVLARDVVRYVGEPIAVVVAPSRYLAEDAAELVAVDFRPLPAVTEDRGAAQDRTLLHRGLGTNVVYRRDLAKGDAEAALRAAPRRLTLELSVQRHSGVPIETRGLLAVPEADGRLTIHGPTKVVHFNREVLAGLLGVAAARLRLVEPDVGGGFGIRGEFYPEDFLVPWLALRLGRPVRWIEDRGEHLRAANHSREQRHVATVGFDESGRLLALRDEIWVDQGAYVRTHGVTVPELTQAMLPGPYDWPAFDLRLRVVLTNKTPAGTYRGPGRFEGTFVRERLMEAMAQEIGLSPNDVRRRNLIADDRFPYAVRTSALGQEIVFDSGRYAPALALAEERLGAQGFAQRREEAQARGLLRGMGWAFFVEKSGLGPHEDAEIELEPDGTFVCRTGLAALGQGTETILAQIAADRLDATVDEVRVVHGDTDLVPQGLGSFASRGTAVGGAAAYVAAQALREKIAMVAAAILEVAPDDVALAPGRAVVRGVPARGVPLREIAAQAVRLGVSLTARHRFEARHMTYPYGVHGAEVEVDPAVGAVRIVRYVVVYDVGRAVNPMLLEGQIVGGVAQGLGGALLEEFAYDAQGQLLSGTFVDYLLPGATEMPEVDVAITEDAPSPHNPLGAKGGGEGGAVGVAPALANALADALRAPPGTLCRLPIRPEEVLRLAKRMSASDAERGSAR